MPAVDPQGSRCSQSNSQEFGDQGFENRAEHTPGIQHPLLTIWSQPRETMRRILDEDPTRLVVPLAMSAGIEFSLIHAVVRHAGDELPMVVVLGVTSVLGSVGGVLWLYALGMWLSWLGEKFGGVADSRDVRSAIAWSLVPAATALVTWPVRVATIGVEMFTKETPRVHADPSLHALLLVSWAIDIVLGVWTFVLLVKCLSEAHRFSAWRALGTLLLAIGITLVILLVVPRSSALILNQGG